MSNFESELVASLREAKLPANLDFIIGRIYWFGCDHGSHQEILAGTILAINLSDEGDLQLEVSNSRFFGAPLKGLGHRDGQWGAIILEPNSVIVSNFFQGEFRLL